MAITTDITLAVEQLRRGGVVAFPTETVYGLGADASNPAATQRIFTIKGRPANHPLIVHIGDAGMMPEWAREIPPAARRLAGCFWPGPLTLILKRGKAPMEVTGGQDSVGLRMPDHPVALELLRAFGGGIAAPSANRFGRVSPTRAVHVRDELGDDVDLILEGGNCRVGLESTILSLIDEQPRLLRPGAISQAELEIALGETILTGTQTTVRAPGMLDSHYAPHTRMLICPTENLVAAAVNLISQNQRLAVMQRTPLQFSAGILTWPMPEHATGYGQALYAALRDLDQRGLDVILVEQPPDDPAWRAINDRLGRASHDVRQSLAEP